MSDFEVIPQAAIDHLTANPDTAAGFDSVFGAGRAAEILAPKVETRIATSKKDEDEGLSFVGKMWDATGRAVGYGVQEAINETVDAVESFDMWASQKLDERGIPSRLSYEDGWPKLKMLSEVKAEENLFALVPEVEVVQQPETLAGGIVGGVSQFAAGFVAAGKFTKLAGLRGAFVNGAIADAVVFDPNDANVMATLETLDVDTGALGEILATDADDPEYINRLRNVAEGVVAGGIVEALGWGVKAARARHRGQTELVEEFIENQDKALKVLDDAVADAADEVAKDAEQSIDLAKTLFDGEDLIPTTPKAVTEPNPKRIYMTPDRVEEVRMQGQLAKGASIADKQEGLSFRSLNTVTDFEEVVDDIAGVREVLKQEYTDIKGGQKQTWATVKVQSAAKLREMANMTGEDPEAVISRFMGGDIGDPAQLAAEVHARSSYLLTVEKELKAMAKVITEGTFDPKEWPGIKDIDHLRLAFAQRREVGANLLAGQDALRSNVARAMNAMKLAVKGDEALQKALRDPANFRDIDTAARAVVDGADEPALKVINETMEQLHGFMDKVNTFRINALLSGPGTQEVNMISNVVNGLVIPTEQLLGAASKLDVRHMKHALRTFQGYFAGMIDAGKASLDAGWHDDAILDPFSAKIEDEALRQATSKAGKVLTAPSRFLMTMDEFFKQSQYRGRVFADAADEASQQGLKGVEREAFIKTYLKESYDETGAALRGDALLQARRATFTEPLEGGVAQMVQQAAIKHPTIRFIIPFVRTPVNILSQSLQHVPIAGALSSRWKADLAAGGVRAAQARGKWLVGGSLISMAGYMAAQGQITGSGPKDPRIRKVWLQNNQPYAFKFINEDGTVEWVSYARMEPLSNIFSIAADMVEINKDQYNEAETNGVMMAMFMAVMENSVNKTFTQGISDAMQIMTSAGDYKAATAMRNFVGSFVPNILNQLNGDEAMREARSMADAILARTHLYNGLDPKRNVLGEPVLRRLPKYDPLGLTESDTRVIDPVLEEVTRVAILNQTVADNPARRIPGPNRIDLSKVPYSDTQSLYDRWVELTGEVEIGGKTLREKLASTMESSSYKRAPDGFVGATSGTKGAIIRKVISSYRKKAKSELPELTKLIREEQRGGAEMMKAQTLSNRELFPSKPKDLNNVAPSRRSFEDLIAK